MQQPLVYKLLHVRRDALVTISSRLTGKRAVGIGDRFRNGRSALKAHLQNFGFRIDVKLVVRPRGNPESPPGNRWNVDQSAGRVPNTQAAVIAARNSCAAGRHSKIVYRSFVGPICRSAGDRVAPSCRKPQSSIVGKKIELSVNTARYNRTVVMYRDRIQALGVPNCRRVGQFAIRGPKPNSGIVSGGNNASVRCSRNCVNRALMPDKFWSEGIPVVIPAQNPAI